MKLNENTKLIGDKVVLVPYKKCHVNKYHKWMQSKELLEKTASEPLTLEEEYEMQDKWWKDDDKCTFIVLCKQTFSQERDTISSMVGDVNLFLNNCDDKSEAELEVMIAETAVRGNGYGKETVKLMMYYGYKNLSIKKYVVKIGADNQSSINLFLKLGFQEESFSEVFQEGTYALPCKDDLFQESVINEIESYIQEKKFL